MAKAVKGKTNVPERKYTSYGVSLIEIEADECKARSAADAERRDIINFVKQKSVDQSILDEDIFLMDVNCYCKANGSYLMGEFSFLRFSLWHGVKDSYHELINPGGIPIGYALDVKLGSKELGLPMPDDTHRATDYIQILANVVDYLRRRDNAPTNQIVCQSARRPTSPPIATFRRYLADRAGCQLWPHEHLTEEQRFTTECVPIRQQLNSQLPSTNPKLWWSAPGILSTYVCSSWCSKLKT